MRFSLFPESRRFYDLVEESGTNVLAAAQALDDLLSDYTDLKTKLERLHDLEHKGDEITHKMIDELNGTFVTPFDREDLSFLARRLDDVVDFAWAAAMRLEAYSIDKITPTAATFGKLILRESEVLNESVRCLRDRKRMRRILDIAREVHDIENQADTVLRQALAKRYNSGPHTIDTLILGMKWSEIYAILEKATDRGEDVADTLQGIALKYA